MADEGGWVWTRTYGHGDMGRSIEKEITPRLNFLEYLHERGEFIPGEGVPQYVARQPFCLEMKLMELYSGAPPFH